MKKFLLIFLFPLFVEAQTTANYQKIYFDTTYAFTEKTIPLSTQWYKSRERHTRPIRFDSTIDIWGLIKYLNTYTDTLPLQNGTFLMTLDSVRQRTFSNLKYLSKVDSAIVSAGYGIGVTQTGHTATVRVDTAVIPSKGLSNIFTATNYFIARFYGTSAALDTIVARSAGNKIYVLDTLVIKTNSADGAISFYDNANNWYNKIVAGDGLFQLYDGTGEYADLQLKYLLGRTAIVDTIKGNDFIPRSPLVYDTLFIRNPIGGDAFLGIYGAAFTGYDYIKGGNGNGFIFTVPNVSGTLATINGGQAFSNVGSINVTGATELDGTVDLDAVYSSTISGKPNLNIGSDGKLRRATDSTANVSGTGTLNYLPLWTGTSTLGNSVITQASNGDAISVPDSFNVTGSIKAGANATLVHTFQWSGANGFKLYRFGNTVTAASGRIVHEGGNSANAETEYAYTEGVIQNNTATIESGAWRVQTKRNGVIAPRVGVDSSGNFQMFSGGTGSTVIDSVKNITALDVTVNGGDLTTNQTTFNLVNATATTVNFAGAGTSNTIGATTGKTTIRNDTLMVEGDIKMQTAGQGIFIKEGSNATMGQATLVAGTATVNTTKVTANSRIFLTVNGGTLTNVGATYVSARTAGTSFTITSMNILDASNVAWMIFEPTGN